MLLVMRRTLSILNLDCLPRLVAHHACGQPRLLATSLMELWLRAYHEIISLVYPEICQALILEGARSAELGCVLLELRYLDNRIIVARHHDLPPLIPLQLRRHKAPLLIRR